VTALLQSLNDLEAAFGRERIDPAPFAAVLERVRAHVRLYAKLEKDLVGAVTVTYPAHLLEGIEVDSVEALADRERRRLELDRHETTDLMELLDREGLKVVRVRFPEGSPLEGFFLFDPETGPVFVVDAALERRAADMVFARLYGYFLLDTDPYQIRLARRAGDATDPSAERSFEFAAALLVSRMALRAYLVASGWSEGQAVGPEQVEQLAVYFDVSRRTILARVLSLGIPVADLPASLEEGDAASAPAEGAAPETGSPETSTQVVLPERFVRLALEAHSRGRLPVADLARALDTDTEGATRLAARFQLGENGDGGEGGERGEGEEGGGEEGGEGESDEPGEPQEPRGSGGAS